MDRYSDIPYNKEQEAFDNDLDLAVDEMTEILCDRFHEFIEEQVDMNINHENENFNLTLINELKKRLSIKID